jgi:hypothetical protein
MEWVVIKYPRVRDVFINGRRSGATNRILAVAEGTHRFDLGVPSDYCPDRRIITVTETSDGAPMNIEFTPAA